MATGTVILPVQGAKIGGSYILAGAQIEGGQATWKALFDASATESILFQFRVPANYSSSPVLKIQYSMASATSGGVDFECEVMCVTTGDAQDTDAGSFDTVNEVTGGDTVPGTAGYMKEVSITLTNADSIAAGDLILLRINRDHDDSDDTATGDAEILAVSFEYTTS